MRRRKPTATDWLGYAAAPVFALMAMATAVTGDDHMAMLCSQARASWVPTGMVPMYLLMALFHLPPWFRLAARN